MLTTNVEPGQEQKKGLVIDVGSEVTVPGAQLSVSQSRCPADFRNGGVQSQAVPFGNGVPRDPQMDEVQKLPEYAVCEQSQHCWRLGLHVVAVRGALLEHV
jgi:hypothetical protein